MVIFDGVQRNIDGPMECTVSVRDGVARIWTRGMSHSMVVSEGERAIIEFDACIQEALPSPIRLRIGIA
jgi:hypothetical protein